MKLNLFKTRNKTTTLKHYNDTIFPIPVWTSQYGTGNYIRETYSSGISEFSKIDHEFMLLSMHSPMFIQSDKIQTISLNQRDLEEKFGFYASEQEIRSSVFLPVIIFQNQVLNWRIKKEEQQLKLKKQNPLELRTGTATTDTVIYTMEYRISPQGQKEPTVDSETIYKVRNASFDIFSYNIGFDNKVVSKKTYESVGKLDKEYQLLGFWNFITNEFIVLYDFQAYPDLTTLVLDKISKHKVNSSLSKAFQSGYEYTLGWEQEFLFMKDKEVIPATNVIVDKLKSDYNGLNEHSRESLLTRGRDTLNNIFNFTGIGTDGRRILGEMRGDYFVCNGRNEQQTKHAVYKLWGAIESSYEMLFKTGYDIKIGGGLEGETIGSHIHFNVLQSPEFVIFLNKIFGSKLQNMIGGKRPEFINPADRFTTDSGQRTQNNYGRIINDLGVIQHDFNDNHGVQVRPKQSQDGSAKWWEWRIPPACFINRTYTVNLLMSIWEIINKSSKGFEFPHYNENFNTKILLDIFGKSSYFWEWWFMSNSLWLSTSPFVYTIYGEIEKLLFGSNFTILKTSKKESFIKDPENFDLQQLRFAVKDYINPEKKYIFKFERNKENTICVHISKKPSLEFWIEMLGIHITPIYKTIKEFNNSCFISGFYSTQEIQDLTKTFLMIS